MLTFNPSHAKTSTALSEQAYLPSENWLSHTVEYFRAENSFVLVKLVYQITGFALLIPFFPLSYWVWNEYKKQNSAHEAAVILTNNPYATHKDLYTKIKKTSFSSSGISRNGNKFTIPVLNKLSGKVSYLVLEHHGKTWTANLWPFQEGASVDWEKLSSVIHAQDKLFSYYTSKVPLAISTRNLYSSICNMPLNKISLLTSITALAVGVIAHYSLSSTPIELSVPEQIKTYLAKHPLDIKLPESIAKYLPLQPIQADVRFITSMSSFFVSAICGVKSVSGSSHVKKLASASIHPLRYPAKITNDNKQFAYDLLMKNQAAPTEPIKVTKYGLKGNRSMNLETREFSFLKPVKIKECSGPFSYDSSSEMEKHWTVNFADSHLFGYCQGDLLAQDELQVLEHPLLYHLKEALSGYRRLRSLALHEVTLVENIAKHGSLNIKPWPLFGHSLYGNNFANATTTYIRCLLTRVSIPKPSNILAMVAPQIHPALAGTPYQRKHLEELLYTAYTGCMAIKKNSGSAKAILHTGNWGAGAFGNDSKTVALMQLIGARLAGLDEMRYYPLNQSYAFQEAQELLEKIEKYYRGKKLTIDLLLDNLTKNANKYNLRYGQSNGT